MRPSSALFFLITLFPGSAFASVNEFIVLDKDSGKVTFTAIGQPSALRVQGTGEGPEGKITLRTQGTGLVMSGALQLALESLDTGLELRNRHLKEKYLETAKFSRAVLVLEPTAGPAAPESAKDVPFTGVLTLHGRQNRVHGAWSGHRDEGNRVGINAHFTLKLTDFGVVVPSYLGITVADEVNVQVDFAFARQPAAKSP